MEEQDILERFWDRDSEAIQAVGERYGSRLFRLAERMLGSCQDAEECVNDTYLAAWNAIPPERPMYLGPICLRYAEIWL